MSRRDQLTDWIDGRLTSLRVDAIRQAPEPWASVVGVDRQEHSRWAAQWAAALTPNAHLVFARQRGQEGAGCTPEAMENLAGDARVAFEELDEVLGETSVNRHVMDWAPAPALNSASGVLGADVVVVPPHLHEPMESAPVGHVAESLAHSSGKPILFANGPPTEGEVLAGLAVERSSRGAAVWGVNAADALDAPLRAVHVTRKDPSRRDPINEEGYESRGPRAESVIREGTATDVLLEEIRERDLALTVVGHGRRADWIGSTARDLIEAVEGPLLVVPFGYAPDRR